ncbi:hypothetical protein D9C73_024937 [Collichthys lucidus]|uniref:Uncharacterized protein n=1 Tax=Collichthys lucidus TaxID=240159 RepID=A0A4U5VQC6_COLLU|nr:hypothetical protein D9C73_024937 [Collichthys lucidus]
MKVGLGPRWTSISLCHPPPRPSPIASSLGFPSLIGSVHTCGEPAALSNSRQRPQTGWLQITFKSKKKYGWDSAGGRKLSIHWYGLWSLLAGGLAGDMPRLSFIPETWAIGQPSSLT